jgi:hypothetical protein
MSTPYTSFCQVVTGKKCVFATIQEFQKWYSGELMPKATSQDFINVPIKNIQGEYMVLRPL